MLEVLLTREDANTEFALLAEWLVADGEPVEAGQPICIVETTKATVEVETPGAGSLVHLFAAGAEVELGGAVGLIAESESELAEARTRVSGATAAPEGDAKATRKARELAERHGIDLGSIEKRGFITAGDVEALFPGSTAGADAASAADPLLGGVSTAGVSLPESWSEDLGRGRLDPAFVELLRSEPERIAQLGSDEKCAAYREAGAVIGEGVELGAGALIVAERVVIGARVSLGERARIECAESFCVGELTHVGPDLELRCQRAFVGANVHGGRSIRIGGGGHRDPWATLAVGDLAFLGDEIFVNVCRPVLIGRETFVTQRAMIVTHNIGHSLLEGFENRFAPVVVEDRAQIGLGAVVYAGCRIGERAIIASNSYVVSDIPSGKLAIGVPARPAGDVQVRLSEQRRAELAHQMVDELYELLELRGHTVSWLPDAAVRVLRIESELGSGQVALLERADAADALPAPSAATESVALSLVPGGVEVPAGWAVLDLLAQEVRGDGGVVLDSVREFCRKRGIRFGGAPWRYSGGLI